MSANRVEYHQGAIADIKSAVAWYQKRSNRAALDFIEIKPSNPNDPRSA